ncbi:MAG: hypothetical protein EWM73_00255 [Nitrospira sp.]|nr:MAG: hypothetical protein EWM73_00255 [Nitrospira sp.]
MAVSALKMKTRYRLHPAQFGVTLFFQGRHQSFTVVGLPQYACLTDDGSEIAWSQRPEL